MSMYSFWSSALSSSQHAAVLSDEAAAVGVTTGLVGAGGFGKTTSARMVAHDPRVRQEFRDGVVWVTVGEDTSGPDLAMKLGSAARLFDASAPEVTDPVGAGAVLGRVLADRRVLLVVDDVWSTGQVEPFLLGGNREVRLFTTRQQGVLPDEVTRVRVDQMSQTQARRLLIAGLPAAPPMPPRLVRRALRATGRWPVLVSLVHGAVYDAAKDGGGPASELADVLAALRIDGITALAVHDPGERGKAVAATIEQGRVGTAPARRPARAGDPGPHPADHPQHDLTDAVHAARATDISWTVIADAAGITPQSAQERWSEATR